VSSFKQVHRTFHVHALIQRRFFETGPDASPRREVNDLIELLTHEKCVDRRPIRQIALHEGKRFPQCLDVPKIPSLDFGIVKRIKIVEGDDAMAGAKQPFANMRADKTRTACHEKIHMKTLAAAARRVEGGALVRAPTGRSRIRFGTWMATALHSACASTESPLDGHIAGCSPHHGFSHRRHLRVFQNDFMTTRKEPGVLCQIFPRLCAKRG